MHDLNPARFYRIYRGGFTMSLRHYPYVLEDSSFDGEKVTGPLGDVDDPLVILGALDPLAKKRVGHMLGETELVPYRIEEMMLDRNPDKPLVFENLVRFIEDIILGERG